MHTKIKRLISHHKKAQGVYRSGLNLYGPKNIILFILFFAFGTGFAQYRILPQKRDDFISKKSWWEYHKDGTVKKDPDAVKIENGHLVLSLSDPDDRFECNVGISEAQNIYGKHIKFLAVETRLRVLNEMKPGSRGWGFWKSAKGGFASSLAWFMEQFSRREKGLSWKMAGVIAKKKRATHTSELDDENWHTYRIERDLIKKTTTFLVDGQVVFSAPGLVPREKMSFHLWVDNQVYSKKQGIKRQQWQGTSAIAVDYVQIFCDRAPAIPFTTAGRLHETESPNIFGDGTKDQILREYSIKLSGESALLLATARAEANTGFADPDRLWITDGQQADKPLMIWDGSELDGSSACFSSEIAPGRTENRLTVHSDVSPLFSNITVLSHPGGRIVLNDVPTKQPNAVNSAAPWKAYPFSLKKDCPVWIYISGSADESPGWNHSNAASANETNDDDLKIFIDQNDFGWNNPNALCGNSLFGDNQAILIKDRLNAGNHTLKLIAENSPTVYRVVIYAADN